MQDPLLPRKRKADGTMMLQGDSQDVIMSMPFGDQQQSAFENMDQ